MQHQLTITEKLFDTGEITLNYAESGKTGAPPLLLLHGGLRWWQDWEPIIPALAARWHVYAPDLRGHGKSGRDGQNYRLPDFVRDISVFLTQQIGQPAAIIGQSLGALTALGVGAAVPEQSLALVLLDPPLFLRSESINVLTQFRDWFQFVYGLTSAASSYDDLTERVRAVFPDGDAARLKTMVDSLYGLDPAMIDILLRDQLLDGFDAEAELERITSPALFLQADWDQGGAMRDSDADFAQQHVRGAVIHKFPGLTHLLLQEHPDLVLEETQAFLQSVGERS